MLVSRATSRLVLVAVIALLAGCGAEGPRGADLRPSASRTSATPTRGAWAYEYVSEAAPAGNKVLDIAAVSAHEAWAIAQTYAPGSFHPEMPLLRFDGTRWRTYELSADLRDALGGGSLKSVTLHAGAGGAWLFAYVSHGPGTFPTRLAARFDGSRWLPVALPEGSDEVVGGPQVAVLGPSDVWVGEALQQTAWHWGGRGWTATRLPLKVRAITADTAGGDLWVAGDVPDPQAEEGSDPDHPEPRRVQPTAARWDGRRWQEVRMPDVETLRKGGTGLQALVDSLTARGADDVLATGVVSGPYTGSRDAPVDRPPFALHWDGERWSKEDALPPGVLDAKWMRGADGKVRRITRPPYVAGATGKTTGIDRKQTLRLTGIVRIPGTDEFWGVGSVGLESLGDANFSRAVVVRYAPKGRTPAR
ncbi:hypothetical protein [Streptomyces sp. NPDC005181]|uniref:hypothetical protein n=1 Tax=Streptomyces sp. NPDC005181 TaxID=3156869 RepID=UPI0033BC94B3